MTPRLPSAVLAVVGLTAVVLSGQQAAPAQSAPPLFKSAVNLVLVDVSVRDKKGAIVKNLTADDFDLYEDGRKQQVVSFSFEAIANNASPLENVSAFSAVAGAAVATGGAPPPSTLSPIDQPEQPLTSDEVAGRRLITMLFDTSSMQPEDVQKAIDSAQTWVDDQMSPADLVAVATIGASLQVLTDFTSSKDQVKDVLAQFSGADGMGFADVDASTAATDDANNTSSDNTASSVDASAQELDTFNNDVRLRAIKTLAEALEPIQQMKAILYFSSGMQRNGTDNQVELRAAVNAAVRANVKIYPVDARGLQAVVPGGSARQASKGGVTAFSGVAVAQQFTKLYQQQETLTTLAADTGGTAFTDTNDFGEAFAKAVTDISSYYILGYRSTNPARDGRFRRISVKLKQPDLKVDARAGYYADRDFTHTAKADREVQLQEQLMMQIPATDVPVFLTTGWFRLASNRYYVPVSLAVPGSAVPASTETLTLDVAGFIRDERNLPVGRIRGTIKVPPSGAENLSARQILFETGVTLPPGRFSVKVVVRENVTGQMGTFETPIVVPELKKEPVQVSSLVLSTQLEPVKQGKTRKTTSPLVRDGVEVVPNLTHIVGRNQELYFYYEVYDPAVDNGAPELRTSLAFYRGTVKVFETPVVVRSTIDAPDRHAAIFQFELPADRFKPGLYTCQVNIIDEVASRVAFPRLDMYVR